MSEHKTTDPLETLRPEVRDTLDWIEAEYPEASTIRTELLRLVKIETERWGVVATRNAAIERAEKAEAELAAVRASQQWRPLETLPPLEVPIWLYEHGDIYIGMRADSGEGWLWSKCYSIPWYNAKDGWTEGDPEEDDDYQPTFWMPLPEPPAERGEG